MQHLAIKKKKKKAQMHPVFFFFLLLSLSPVAADDMYSYLNLLDKTKQKPWLKIPPSSSSQLFETNCFPLPIPCKFWHICPCSIFISKFQPPITKENSPHTKICDICHLLPIPSLLVPMCFVWRQNFTDLQDIWLSADLLRISKATLANPKFIAKFWEIIL